MGDNILYGHDELCSTHWPIYLQALACVCTNRCYSFTNNNMKIWVGRNQNVPCFPPIKFVVIYKFRCYSYVVSCCNVKWWCFFFKSVRKNHVLWCHDQLPGNVPVCVRFSPGALGRETISRVQLTRSNNWTENGRIRI